MNELAIQQEMSRKTNAELVDIIIRLLKLLGVYEIQLGCLNAHDIVEGEAYNGRST